MVLSDQSLFGPVALILGIAGVIPMLALSRSIETSESPLVSGLNLSTNMAVLRLFGPTSQPIPAFVVSLFLSVTTGVVEETVFRGQGEFFSFDGCEFSRRRWGTAFFHNRDHVLFTDATMLFLRPRGKLFPFLRIPTETEIF